MNDPIKQLIQWLGDEHKAGAPNPRQAVLATATCQAVPHSRVVAIREINVDGSLVFFTQKGTRKVTELTENPLATVVFWFELLQREVIIEGHVSMLSETENNLYWEQYPREAQIRFYSYAATSMRPIPNKQLLENKKKQIEQEYANQLLPISPYYCGFRLIPDRLFFYAYRTDELSDVCEYINVNNHWRCNLLSP